MSHHYSKKKSSKIYHEWLRKKFPKCFNGAFHPLSLAIFKEIAEQLPDDISKRQLRSCIGWYTSRVKYYEATCANEFRVNLDGADAEQITKSDIENAQLNLIKIYMLRADKRQSLEDQEKNKELARRDFLNNLNDNKKASNKNQAQA